VEDDRPKRSAFRLRRHVVVHGERQLELLLHSCTYRNQMQFTRVGYMML
jgi:hypothetical protein